MMFLVLMLREEVDVDAGVRERLLESIRQHAVLFANQRNLVHPNMLISFDMEVRLREVMNFSRRHGAAVKTWLNRIGPCVVDGRRSLRWAKR